MRREWPLLLVVEDSDEDFDTVCEAAKLAGIDTEIRRALSGGDALELLAKADTNRRIIVFLDLNTPGINGREALAQLKQDPGKRDIPIVVITTSSDPRDLSYCYASGANAYHVKPVAYPDHLRIVGEAIDYWFNAVTLPGVRPV